MANMIPLEGGRDGYRYEFVTSDVKGTRYKITSPDGQTYLVNCAVKSDVELMVNDPAAFMRKYSGNYHPTSI